jgi:hypothetical protein
MTESIDNCDRVNLDEVPGLAKRLHPHQGVGGLVVTKHPFTVCSSTIRSDSTAELEIGPKGPCDQLFLAAGRSLCTTLLKLAARSAVTANSVRCHMGFDQIVLVALLLEAQATCSARRVWTLPLTAGGLLPLWIRPAISERAGLASVCFYVHVNDSLG